MASGGSVYRARERHGQAGTDSGLGEGGGAEDVQVVVVVMVVVVVSRRSPCQVNWNRNGRSAATYYHGLLELS